jgi:hypothetical protein
MEVEMFNKAEVSGLQLVPEDIVEYCADACSDVEDNSFRRILKAGYEFRDAGLKPVYICSTTLQDLFVTTEEMLQRKLH